MKVLLLFLLGVVATTHSLREVILTPDHSITVPDAVGTVQGSVKIGYLPPKNLSDVHVEATKNVWESQEFWRSFPDLNIFQAKVLGPYHLSTGVSATLHNFNLFGFLDFEINDLEVRAERDAYFRIDANITFPNLAAESDLELRGSNGEIEQRNDVFLGVAMLTINVALGMILVGTDDPVYQLVGLEANGGSPLVMISVLPQENLPLPDTKIEDVIMVDLSAIDAVTYKKVTDEIIQIVGREVYDLARNLLDGLPASGLENIIMDGLLTHRPENRPIFNMNSKHY